MRSIRSSRISVTALCLIVAIAITTSCRLSASDPEPSSHPEHSTRLAKERPAPTNDKFVFASEVNTLSGSGAKEPEFNRLLLAKEFMAIEAAADRARKNKERLPGGTWKIDAIYNGLITFFAEHKGQLVTDRMWVDRIELIKQWKLAMPESVTARIALAKAYVDHGLYARGRGYIDSVSQNDYETFQSRLAAAEEELWEAKAIGPNCPRWYREIMMVGLALGWPDEKFEKVYQDAIKSEPNYLQYYLIKSERLTPKWSGRKGDWRKFVDSLPDELATVRGAEADIIYFVVLANKVGEPSLKENWTTFPKDRILRGFTQIEEKYGIDNYRLNQFAFLATLTLDLENSKRAFDRIGVERNGEIWNERTFNMMKQLAKEGVPKRQA